MFLAVKALLTNQTEAGPGRFEAVKLPKEPEDQHSRFRPRDVGRHRKLETYSRTGLSVKIVDVTGPRFSAKVFDDLGTAREIGVWNGGRWKSKARIDI